MTALIAGNVVTAGALLDACRESAVRRVILLGSGFEYAPSTEAISEVSAIGPTTPYGALKAVVSSIVRQVREDQGLDVCVVRPFSVYGPREQPHRFIPYVVTAALVGEDIQMSSGAQLRDYLYVEDLADGIERAAAHVGPLPEALNFSGSEVHRLGDIANLVVELTSSASKIRLGSRSSNPGDRAVFLGDHSRAHALLDWDPKTRLRDGLRHTVDWYAERRELWAVPA
jgi:UDP-glucose 4-epimerase